MYKRPMDEKKVLLYVILALVCVILALVGVKLQNFP